jgi:hypothetical protein
MQLEAAVNLLADEPKRTARRQLEASEKLFQNALETRAARRRVRRL